MGIYAYDNRDPGQSHKVIKVEKFVEVVEPVWLIVMTICKLIHTDPEYETSLDVN